MNKPYAEKILPTKSVDPMEAENKLQALIEYRNASKTYKRLNCLSDIHTIFENFHYVYGFGDEGFCNKDSLISDQRYVEYSDPRVTSGDIRRITASVKQAINVRVRHIMDEEEKNRLAEEFKNRFESELAKDME